MNFNTKTFRKQLETVLRPGYICSDGTNWFWAPSEFSRPPVYICDHGEVNFIGDLRPLAIHALRVQFPNEEQIKKHYGRYVLTKIGDHSGE